jgi:hypothetical protein
MNWIEQSYPIGSTIQVPHPDLGDWMEAEVVNHYLARPDPNRPNLHLQGLVVRFEDGVYMLVDSAFLAEEDNTTITLSEAASVSEIPYSTLAEWAREKKLLARQSGSIWLTTRQALDEAIARLRPQKGE